MVSKIHGNANGSHHTGAMSPIASDHPPTAVWAPQSNASDTSPRPPLTHQQSSSLPSTPYQHARNIPFTSRTPSPVHGSTSPHSTHSEATHLPPAARKPYDACKFETAMTYSRRRMPYSLGTDLLPQENLGPKSALKEDEALRLSDDMMVLFDRLIPSAESEVRRQKLVTKLENLFNKEWPGNEIKVHIFGSSGNKLCSSESDVDICITTNFKELEHVCMLARTLASHGMEKVVCVSHAKVPIVKIWDPELKLSCDMNVNNTLALENTRMIRTYVDIDERVRPLAMVVKYWTKRRILNDAALGGTLSSYTWICLIINFLQTRDPPILPSLQTRPHKKKVTSDGVVFSFDDDMQALAGFGRRNTHNVGQLLFEFFRYYAHEFDYEHNVISVREGGLISKEAKGWHLQTNNRLCVEEPFNTIRNLGNTADDTSFKGLHIEMRRAYKCLLQADLTQCCEEFVFPPQEKGTFERPAQKPRPIITQAPPPRPGGRGTGRGPRGPNQNIRPGGSTGSRKNAPAKFSGFRAAPGQPSPATTSPELALQAQQQAQFMLHDQLYQQIQVLQAQEQELRLQLHNQALITGRPAPVFIRQPFIQFPVPHQQEYSGDENSRSRSGTVDHSPISSTSYAPTYASVSAMHGSPPSTMISDLRNPRRSSVAHGEPKGLRAHSQPARPQHSSSANISPLYSIQTLVAPIDPHQQPESTEIGDYSGNDLFLSCNSPSPAPQSASVDDTRPLEYYYPQIYHQGPILPDLSISTCASLGSDHQDCINGEFSSQDSITHPKRSPTESPSPQEILPPSPRSKFADVFNRGPLIVDGSVRPQRRRSYASDLTDQYVAAHYASTSDEQNVHTPASMSDTLSQGFQEPAAFEIDQSSGYEAQLHDTGNLELHRKMRGQPELLSSHLQRLNISNTEPLSQVHHNQLPKQHPAKGNGNWNNASNRERALSQSKRQTPIEQTDSRQQSNQAKRRGHGMDNEKFNGTGHNRPKPKGRHDTPLTKSTPQDVGATNGIKDNNGQNNSHGGWQTSKKKHRRVNKSTDNTHPGQNGANARPGNNSDSTEFMPADETLRKGG
ncbi:PAP/25A-associated [Penicillium taxi]|uniref:PAP/25A-associated n=1 Tax=Penicillium taxi TaxID=168475 RepID=UPI0025454D68|nr:PAP/25A-associated [Penicillium taxi]KAJ5908274.1 PAP/25A-associated [Penicillium taxi]